MANIQKETIAVSSAGPGLLRIDHVQIHDGGIDLGGALVLESSAAAWLADRIDDAAGEQGAPEVDAVMAPDHFKVYVGGSEWQPFVHVHNHRDPAAPHGTLYTLGMTANVARTLATLLRAPMPA